MLDLSCVTDADVVNRLEGSLMSAIPRSDRYRLLGASRESARFHSFVATRTYPRPDHPDPRKRRSLLFLLTAILVSLRTTLENEQRAMNQILERYPDEDALLNAREADIAACISCAGMATKKAQRIRAALDAVSQMPGGLQALALRPTAEARAELLRLSGVGPKAADCLLTIGLGRPSMVVDVNVFRVAAALLGVPWYRSANYGDPRKVAVIKQRLDAAIPDDAFLCQIVHTQLLLAGRKWRSRGHPRDNCFAYQYCVVCEDENRFLPL